MTPLQQQMRDAAFKARPYPSTMHNVRSTEEHADAAYAEVEPLLRDLLGGGCMVVDNEMGTASCFWCEADIPHVLYSYDEDRTKHYESCPYARAKEALTPRGQFDQPRRTIMSTEIIIKFQSVDEAEKVDLTRIGIVAGATEGLGSAEHTVVVEPDIDGWDGVRPEVACEILRSGLAAAGVWVDIKERPQEGEQ